jgi:hypothetical protein
MRKSHFDDDFLVLLGPIIIRFFARSNEKKMVHALILSLWGVAIKPIQLSVVILSVIIPSVAAPSLLVIKYRMMDLVPIL